MLAKLYKAGFIFSLQFPRRYCPSITVLIIIVVVIVLKRLPIAVTIKSLYFSKSHRRNEIDLATDTQQGAHTIHPKDEQISLKYSDTNALYGLNPPYTFRPGDQHVFLIYHFSAISLGIFINFSSRIVIIIRKEVQDDDVCLPKNLTEKTQKVL